MRYLPLTEQNRKSMLEAIGVATIDTLYQNVPKDELQVSLLDLPLHQGELEVARALSAMAAKNHPASNGPFFLGAGCYHHHIPATVDYIIQRSEFLTSYTPYQPEISQGTLAVIFEFQTIIAALTGMDIANASMYDGATSMAEAAMMARRVTKKHNIHLHGVIHPQYVDVLRSYMTNYEDVSITTKPVNEEAACVIIQLPDFYGNIQALDGLRKQCDETGALLIVVVNEIVSLGLLPPPVEADIVAGEAQSIGVPMGFGGPHLGFFACKQEYLRQMPGRLCGETADKDGKRSFVLTLSTREQHIRREKATSNICTNQGLCALAFTVHMSLLGEEGLKTLARLNHEAACRLADALKVIPGVKILTQHFFNEFAVKLPKNAETIVKKLAAKGIVAGYAAAEDVLLVTATEMTTDEEIREFAEALKEAVMAP